LDAVADFEQLRSMLTSPPTLALPKQGLEYVLDTDNTKSQLSACLQQRDEHGVLHPIGYWSRQLSPTERRYHITEKYVSELHITRLCRTEPVAPALPCADLVGAVSRRRVLRLCGWRPFIPSQ
jgi:RNase H-like domain found in reverse transcriptase